MTPPIPDGLASIGAAQSVRLSEAERSHYEAVATSEDIYQVLATALRTISALCASGDVVFANPVDPWLDAPYDAISQADAYRHIAPISDRHVLQLGGMGSHAVGFLLGGAATATLLTPVLAEATAGVRMAQEFGVLDRFHAVVGMAENLPCRSDQFWAIYAGGCVHHMSTELAFPEIARVLEPGGRFAAVEPWRAPFYDLGIRVFGQRERDAGCKPLDRARATPIFEHFPCAQLNLHGAVTRYPLLALYKLKVRPSPKWLYKVAQAEERITDHFPRCKRRGSSLALLGVKPIIRLG